MRSKQNKGFKTTSFARLAGLGSTLAVLIALGVFAGRKLDESWGLNKPVGTAVGAISGLFVGLWFVTKDLYKYKKK